MKDTITTEQIRHINALLGNLNIREQKDDLVHEASQGRTESTKELTLLEATELIKHLKSFTEEKQIANSKLSKAEFEAGQAKRRRILSICHQLPHQTGFTKWDPIEKKRTVDLTRLDEFLTGNKSIFKKKLNYHTAAELSKVIIQFENMLQGYLVKPY